MCCNTFCLLFVLRVCLFFFFFCLQSVLGMLHARKAVRQVHNFTNQNKFPAWGFAPKPVETRKTFHRLSGHRRGPSAALRVCGVLAGTALGSRGGAKMPLLPTHCLSKGDLFENELATMSRQLCPAAGGGISTCSLCSTC